jgi:hypothetical protein
MCLSHIGHQPQDVIPRPRLQHRRIRKHAAVPTDVLAFPGQLSTFVSQPQAGVFHDVEFAARIKRQAMSSRFVVCA